MWRFWLVQLLLLLLYGWTWTEETPVQVQVGEDGVCRAIALDRSLAVECPNLAGGRIGLFNGEKEPHTIEDVSLLDWLAPRSAWAGARLLGPEGQVIWAEAFGGDVAADWEPVEGQWQVVVGELRPPETGDALLRRDRLVEGVTFEATLRRADEAAGVLLLEANGEDGWMFLVSGRNRNGVWWRWEGGQPAEPLVGIPYQKPLLAQVQSFLRGVLRGQQGALLLVGVGYGLRMAQRIEQRILKRTNGKRIEQRILKRTNGKRIEQRILRRTNGEYGRGNRKLLLIGLILVTFGLTTWIAGDLLEGVPHVQDSLTYLFQAETMARGRLWAAAPALPEFFEQEFLLVRDGRWFGKYPPGYPAVLAIGVWLDVPWLVNPLLAALTIPLLYVLGRLLYDRRVGLLAAVLGVASPFFLFMAGDQMAHSAELFWITLCMVCWLKGVRGGMGWRWPVGAGVALGMAFLTRQLTAVVVGLPFVVGVWFFYTLSPGPSPSEGEGNGGGNALFFWRGKGWGGWMGVARPLMGLVGACLPFVVGLYVYQGVMTGSPWVDPRGLFWAYDRVGFGAEVGEPSNVLEVIETADQGAVLAWRYDPSQPPRGHSLARGVYNVERLWSELEVHLFGWPGMVTLAFVWLAFLRPAGRRRLADWLLLVCFVALTLAYVAYWHPGIMYGPRYLFAALPALLLLTARGMGGLADWLKSRGVVAVVVGTLILGNLLFYLPGQVGAHRGYNMVSGRELALVEAAAPEIALVFVDPGQGDWWRYGAFFSGNSPWLDSGVVYARDLGEAENRRLMVVFGGRPAFRWMDGVLVPLH